MRTASAISTGLHVGVLLWATLSFTGETFHVAPAQSMPVDLVSEKQFSQMTKGMREAKKKPVEKPKPFVEKKADTVKPVKDIKAKITKNQEIKATTAKAPEPPPPSKPDSIAQKLKQQSEQKQAKAQPTPLPPQRPHIRRPQPKFNANKIAALLDERTPERTLATGDTLNSTPSLGTAMGNAAQLSQSELDALRTRLMALWNPPVGIKDPQDYVIRIRILLDRSGRLRAPPIVLTSGHGLLFDTARDSAVRAVFRGQPFDMLKPEHYAIWKDIEVTFDPRDMFRG